MAKFEVVMPTDVLKDIQFISNNCRQIFGDMTQEGAKVVYNNILQNVPSEMKKNAELMNTLKITKVYETPTDNGINTKVAFYGYFMNEHKQIVPAPLVANAFEYGTSARWTLSGKYRGQISKKPFMRRSFNKNQIEKAMLQAQRRLSKGILKDE